MAAVRKGLKKRVFNRETITSFLFIVPAVVIFSIFYIYPFFYTFKLSLNEWNGIDLHQQFVGLDNFIELMRDRDWWASMWHAWYITMIALTFQNLFAFALAFACDRDLKMKNFYRVVFFIPPILSEVVVGLIWTWILYAGKQGGEYIGLLNYTLSKIGLSHLAHNWLSDPKTALTCIAIVHSWKGFGWGFIMFLAGLQTIDRQLYEAARVDGANMWGILKNVTLPMMMPVIVVVVILTILGSMQAFVLIMSMMGNELAGATSVPVTQILNSMMATKRFGYACAQGIVFGAILIFISLIFKKVSDRFKQV